ncbi:hypothetical protein Cdeb_00199 [Caldibacillus debilis GB1]|uniref:Uncharacterized protein n=1 Tax=Caldibacillus debilis GB1 TaxID=1339248 RepID=A0A420VHT2_9BACI|nr:hypothetical protein Cdeb_00199 [Caldibacillus debilis GB1]
MPGPAGGMSIALSVIFPGNGVPPSSRIHPKKIREAGPRTEPGLCLPLAPAYRRQIAKAKGPGRTICPLPSFMVRNPAPMSGLPPHPVGFIGGTPRRPFLQPGFCKMPFGFPSQRRLLSFSRSTRRNGRAFPLAGPYPCGDKKMGCFVSKSSLNFPSCKPWAGPASPARSSPLASHFPGFSSAPVRQQRFARQRILSFRHALSHRRSAANDSHYVYGRLFSTSSIISRTETNPPPDKYQKFGSKYTIWPS